MNTESIGYQIDGKCVSHSCYVLFCLSGPRGVGRCITRKQTTQWLTAWPPWRAPTQVGQGHTTAPNPVTYDASQSYSLACYTDITYSNFSSEKYSCMLYLRLYCVEILLSACILNWSLNLFFSLIMYILNW